MDVKNVLSDFRFIGSTVKSLNMKNSFISLSDNRDKLKKTFDVDYWIEEINDFCEEGFLLGLLNLNAKINLRSEKKRLSINLVIQGCFEAPYSIETKTFSEMLSINGCATLYSISRALIMSLSSQALADGNVVLPMINVFRLNEEKQKLEANKKAAES